MRPSDQLPSSLPPAHEPAGHLPLAVLRQYVAGTLPAAEQHRVERHTLACTRCADVLEGLSQTDLATTDQALATLQSRLQARVADASRDAKPVAAAWPLRQIAAVLLLVFVGAAMWLGLRRAATTEGPAAAPEVAASKAAPATRPAAEPVAPPLAPSAAVAPPTAAPRDNAVVASPGRKGPRSAVALQPPIRRGQPSRAVAMQTPSSNPVLSSTDAAAEGVAGAAPRAAAAPDTQQIALSSTSPEGPAARMAASPAAAKAKRAANTATDKVLEGRISSAEATGAGRRTVRGRITDKQTGAGLPGVTVLAKGTSIGASTAADGSFSITVPESTPALVVSYVGYSSAEQPLGRTDTALALALAPDTKSLSEVVVVRREPPPAPISIGALPAGGFRAFQKYLADSLDYPEKALKDQLQGTVKLSFLVAVDGSLQDIKVVRKLSEECDAEAIRLLKEGPPWYAAIVNGRRAARTVQVSVPFRLK